MECKTEAAMENSIVPQKLNIELLNDPAISLLDIPKRTEKYVEEIFVHLFS